MVSGGRTLEERSTAAHAFGLSQHGHNERTPLCDRRSNTTGNENTYHMFLNFLEILQKPAFTWVLVKSRQYQHI